MNSRDRTFTRLRLIWLHLSKVFSTLFSIFSYKWKIGSSSISRMLLSLKSLCPWLDRSPWNRMTLTWCGKQSSLFPIINKQTNKPHTYMSQKHSYYRGKKKKKSTTITTTTKTLLRFMKKQKVRYHCLWLRTGVWSLQICSKALTTW